MGQPAWRSHNSRKRQASSAASAREPTGSPRATQLAPLMAYIKKAERFALNNNDLSPVSAKLALARGDSAARRAAAANSSSSGRCVVGSAGAPSGLRLPRTERRLPPPWRATIGALCPRVRTATIASGNTRHACARKFRATRHRPGRAKSTSSSPALALSCLSEA